MGPVGSVRRGRDPLAAWTGAVRPTNVPNESQSSVSASSWPKPLVASAGMVSPLARFAAEALAQVGDADGQRSFALWMETAHGGLARGDAYEAFSSEAAFAAAARAVLDAHLGARAAELKT